MISISDSVVHLIGLGVMAFLAYIGLLIKFSMSKVASTCEKIDGKIDTHIEVCGVRRENVERRLNILEEKRT